MSPSLDEIRVSHADRAGQDAFVRYVPRVFDGIGFQRWRELGGWTHDYRAFGLADGGEIVANVSVQRMTLVLGGRELTGWQLGAVGVVPEWRGRGLQRRILARVCDEAGAGDVMLLFGHPGVRDFYPRFGFERVVEHRFTASCAIAPGGSPARPLSLQCAEDRALLRRIAESSEPVTRRFGARGYAGIVLWYWTNFYEGRLFHLPEEDAIVVAEQDRSLLRICDILAPARIELARHLPRLVTAPVTQLEFGFTPERYWPEAEAGDGDPESILFVRGCASLPTAPFKFPMLAQT